MATSRQWSFLGENAYQEWVESTEPDPALDPVLVKIRDLYVSVTERHLDLSAFPVAIRAEWCRRTGVCGYGSDIDAAIRAYVRTVPDDAVLRERIREAVKLVEHRELADRGYIDAIADAVWAVLRGGTTP